MTESPTPWPARTQALRIGPLVVDLRYRLLRRPDGEVELPHRIFELLLLLVAEPHVLHTRQDLLSRVWPGLVVEDPNLSQSVWALRKALGGAHKDWIRTVSKKGYVFEPPVPIEPVLAEEPVRAASGSGAPAPAPAASAAAPPVASVAPAPVPRPEPVGLARWRPGSRWPLLAIAAGLAALVVISLRLQAEPTAVPPRAVALVEVDDPGSAAADRMPAALLHAWLEWKLGALPELSLLSQAELAVRPPASTVVVLLSSGPLPGDPARMFVQARIDTPDGPRRIQHEGIRSQAAALVDRTSQDVLHALVPGRDGQAWPRLEVEPRAAMRYVELRRARQAREWIRATRIGEDLVRQAPDFALGRLHMAQTLATLGQLPPALEHLGAARRLLHPVPADVGQILDAERLGLSPDHARAARAYEALAERYPHQPMFAIQQARALGRTGRYGDAKAVLMAQADPETWPLATRLYWMTARARTDISLGDYAAARATAANAVRIGEAAGEGWAYERGQSLLTLADAQNAAGVDATVSYERAAARFAAAGDSFWALSARFAGEAAGPYRGELRQLDAWLAQTRAAGQRQLELGALRSAAFHYYRAGDLGRYRERLAQATAVAEDIGDRLGLVWLGVDALNDDFFRGRHDRVERQLDAMLRSGVQGAQLLWTRQFQALLASDRGQYAQALAVLDAATAQARAGRKPGDPPPAIEKMFACTKGGVLLSQARAMEARSAYALCGKGPGSQVQSGRIGLAETEMMAGDLQGALRHLRAVADEIPRIRTAPDRWALQVDLAALLVRAGETHAAQAQLDAVLPKLERQGLNRAAMFGRLALAEIAMARGDVAQARIELAATGRLMSRGLWIPRLEQLEVAIARAEGDEVRAERILAELDHQAHQRQDTLAQLLAHSLMPADLHLPGCTRAQRAALVARTGFHAARLDWLDRREPYQGPGATIPAPLSTGTGLKAQPFLETTPWPRALEETAS